MKPAKEIALVNEVGLTAEQMTQAVELQKKFPSIVKAHEEKQKIERKMGEKWFTLCDELRGSGLNGRELSLLLQSLGYIKQRITEIRKVIEVDAETWDKYKARLIGFRAIVKQERLKIADAEAGEGEGEGEGEASAKDKALEREIPADVYELIRKAITDGQECIVPTGKGAYKACFLVEFHGHGRKYTLTLKVDDVAKR